MYVRMIDDYGVMALGPRWIAYPAGCDTTHTFTPPSPSLFPSPSTISTGT